MRYCDCLYGRCEDVRLPAADSADFDFCEISGETTLADPGYACLFPDLVRIEPDCLEGPFWGTQNCYRPSDHKTKSARHAGINTAFGKR